MPVLVIHHRKDDCSVAPYDAAARVAERDPALQFVTIDPRGKVAQGDCERSKTIA